MSRVKLRVHGPILHRRRWRLDVFDHGTRTKLSYATYGEALQAAREILTGRKPEACGTVSAAEEDSAK